MMNSSKNIEDDLTVLENTCRIKEKQKKMIEEIANNKRILQENYMMMKTEQETMTQKVESINKRMKQQEKRLDENNETIDEIKSLSENKSREIEDLKKELARVTNWVYNLEKHTDSLRTNVCETEITIHDLGTKYNNSNVMELVEKTRDDVRNLEAKQTKTCDHFRKTCSSLENKITVQSKSLNKKVMIYLFYWACS